jgi:hypothetical protein
MRDTGIITKGLSGDADTATTQIGHARTQLGILKNQMQFAGLQVGARTVRLADGTAMRVSVAGGVSRVEIYNPPVTGSPQPQIHLHNPLPVPVPVPIPDQYGFACYAGSLGTTLFDSTTLVFPFQLGENIYSALSEAPHILGTGLVYGFPAGSTNSFMMLNAVDVNTGAPLSDQPAITATYKNTMLSVPASTQVLGSTLPVGLVSPSSMKSSLAEFGSIKTEPPGVTGLLLAPAWEEVPILLSATTDQGQTVSGGVTIEGDANYGVTTNGLIFADSSSVNGVPGDAFYTACPQGLNIVAAVAALSDPGLSFTGIMNILYPGNNTRIDPDTGGQQAGRWGSFVIAGSGSGVDLSYFDEDGSLQFEVDCNVFGVSTWAGSITITDGYGTVRTFPISISITITT